jgi:hypothetical protein
MGAPTALRLYDYLVMDEKREQLPERYERGNAALRERVRQQPGHIPINES